ncbi:hypothetical protein P167DRAFT_541339 [Morchella conica CCBAS932]|uniref:Uncharacterized protein n=1 Tax=Morchella conica CCBAS932 TaxID=1392247 RepID=A0A3N4L711_9PEZI|nr:hypothetical protein P167DRAFT_541339 [Morchella conica CCBAS932]
MVLLDSYRYQITHPSEFAAHAPHAGTGDVHVMGIQLAFDKTEEPDRFCNPELLILVVGSARYSTQLPIDTEWMKLTHARGELAGMTVMFQLFDLYSIQSGGEKPMEKLLPESRTPGRSNRNSFVIPSQQQFISLMGRKISAGQTLIGYVYHLGIRNLSVPLQPWSHHRSSLGQSFWASSC